jgi:hypothetical protein
VGRRKAEIPVRYKERFRDSTPGQQAVGWLFCDGRATQERWFRSEAFSGQRHVRSWNMIQETEKQAAGKPIAE